MNALAYTVGQDVMFAAGQVRHHVPRGVTGCWRSRLHVVQQAVTDSTAPRLAKAVSQPSDPAELEAESAATQVMNDRLVKIKEPPSTVVQGLSLGAGIGIGAGILGAAGLGLGIAALAAHSTAAPFTDDELKAYLEGLRGTGRIEDQTDSDNKARAVVDKGLLKRRLGNSGSVDSGDAVWLHGR